ncbi:MAG: beta-galactosidase [Cytophagales bacterium]|nr:beta-galactosidase [Cytophagales bacterium]
MKIRLLIVFLYLFRLSNAQEIIKFDAVKITSRYKDTPFKMGNQGPGGKEIKLNSLYMSVGGKPVVPVMAEMQYSRVPLSQWEDYILKMKACGVNIVATYVFWNHHEYIEGQFDWQGNKNLRDFVKLCGKHGLSVYPRIGPWCHGEARNGGSPDWILQKKNISDRWQHPVYEYYVDRLYAQIAAQFRGLLYKDGGPIIGIQLENEYSRGKDGEYHTLWLKNTAIKYGIDVPIYNVTGWGNGSVPPYEVIPFFGAYPDAPWADNIERSTDCSDFTYNSFVDYEKIGNNLQKKSGYMTYEDYPFFTCEMGVGIQNTYHRRLVVSPIDGLILVNYKLGAGSNLIGYYVFAGGSHPHDPYVSNEENRELTGYWNNNPQISYDFQAAVKESGKLAPSYFQVKKLHYFLNEFGDRLAVTEPVWVKNQYRNKFILRVKGNSGFIFGANYCRNNISANIKDLKFEVNFGQEKIIIPSNPVSVHDSAVFIWPVNMKLNDIILKHASAQPICSLEYQGKPLWVFFQNLYHDPEFCFDAKNISTINANKGIVKNENGKFYVNNLKSDKDCLIEILHQDNNKSYILVLTQEQANRSWLLNDNGNKHFYISSSGMYIKNKKLSIYGENSQLAFSALRGDTILVSDNIKVACTTSGIFTNYTATLKKCTSQAEVVKKGILGNAKWLQSSVNEVKSNTNQQHKFFVKELNIGNTAALKNAQLYLATQYRCRLFVNFVEVNKEITPNVLNKIDVTAYLKKGDNVLCLAFPLHDGNKGFAAHIIGEYFNTDRFDIYTDISWQTHEDIRFPTWYQSLKYLKSPTILNYSPDINLNNPDFSEYGISIKGVCNENINNNYLNILYKGNIAKIWSAHLMVGDDYNSQVLWNLGLSRLGNVTETTELNLTIFPLKEYERIYFDIPISKDSYDKAEIDKIELMPEYIAEFKLK